MKLLIALLLLTGCAVAQDLPARWDELTASDWTKAMEKSNYTCILPSDPAGDQHAGERETSTLLYLRPDLVQMDRATQESGANQRRLSIPDVYTAIWWYAGYPNHYAGEGDKATRELGQLLTESRIENLAKALRAIKADTKAPELQKEFFDRVKK
jgi:creatinine amidohydrolase